MGWAYPQRHILSTKEGTTMLVLTRQVGEKIIVAGQIEITVVAINGGKVRLGVVAPEEVRVDREEIHQQRLARIAPEVLSVK